MIVQHNLLAEFASRQNKINIKSKSVFTERLASGYKINRAADDAANLQISEGMRSRIRGLDQGEQNIQSGVSMVQVAEGAMEEIENMIHRLNELSIKSSNGTNTDADRQAMQEEVDQILSEIERTSQDTHFNGIQLLNNSWGNGAGTLNGLGYIVGQGNITSSGTLDNILNMTSTNWVTTGNNFRKVKYRYTEEYDPATMTTTKKNNTILSTTYLKTGSASIGTPTQIGATVTDPVTNIQSTVFEREDVIDISGTGGVGVAGKIGDNLGAAYIDFKGLGTNFQLSDLVNQGFNSTCNTCNKHYSIKFIDGTGQSLSSTAAGTNYRTKSNSGNPILEIDIMNLPLGGANASGGDIVKAIMDVVQDSIQTSGHFTQYAYDPANASKLYIYDNRKAYAGNPYMATFDPIVFEKSFNETPPRKPMFIQAGPDKKDTYELYLPWVTTERMHLSGLSVLNSEDAGRSIETTRNAVDYISSERMKMGTYQNRMEHGMAYNANASENLTASESRMRDADMADMMVSYSKYNIVQQASQAMIAQANNSAANVLSLFN